MKKLLNISVIAALAILPLAANAATGDIVSGDPAAASSVNPVQADNAVTASASPKYALAVEAATDGNVATANYVKGAYNAAMKAINKVSETASNALTASSEATLTNKTFDANGTGNSISNLETADFATGVVRNSTAGIRATDSAEDDKLVTEKAVASAIDGMVTETGTQTLTNKTISGATITGGTIDASSTNISNLDTGDFASTALATQTGGGMQTNATTASDEKLVTEKAVATALASATTGQVTLNDTQTLTNKTIDADDNTISDLATGNFKTGVIVTEVGATGADTSLPTEQAVREAITTATSGLATQTAVENTVETATISGNIPTVTVWGSETPGTIALQNITISATYAEPSGD